jgi:hypothetical protein
MLNLLAPLMQSVRELARMKTVAILLCALLKAQAAEFWNGAVHYDPPIVMFSNPILNSVGHTNGWEFSLGDPSARTNGHGKVEFRLEDMKTFVAKEPVKPIRTIAQLRAFSEDKLRTIGQASYYFGDLVKLNGSEALIYMSRTNNVPDARRPQSWSCSVCLFWELNESWQKITLLEIMINAEKRETLALLTNSLKTLKLRPENWRLH